MYMLDGHRGHLSNHDPSEGVGNGRVNAHQIERQFILFALHTHLVCHALTVWSTWVIPLIYDLRILVLFAHALGIDLIRCQRAHRGDSSKARCIGSPHCIFFSDFPGHQYTNYSDY